MARAEREGLPYLFRLRKMWRPFLCGRQLPALAAIPHEADGTPHNGAATANAGTPSRPGASAKALLRWRSLPLTVFEELLFA